MPFNAQRAGIVRHRARDDLDQRGFSSAVLTYQRMHFARAQIERDAFESAHAEVRFRDASCFEEKH